MSIEELIERRNQIQLAAENISEEAASLRWQQLGVANRHIERVINGTIALVPGVEREIVQCLERAEN